jgi:lysophospholipase L1-like esterase
LQTPRLQARSGLASGLGTAALFLFGCAAALLLAEIALRIHDPLGQRLHGDRIVLKTNFRHLLVNRDNPRLDPQIVFSKNSVGFRGEDPPRDFDSRLHLLAVGGSTTECWYLSDGKDWPLVLGRLLAADFDGLWLNNAGLDGHSSFGHLVLMKQLVAKLRPRVVLFLVGVNDVGRALLKLQDRALSDPQADTVANRLGRQSVLFSTLLNLERRAQAEKLQLGYREVDLRATPKLLSGKARRAEALAGLAALAPAYRERLAELVQVCRTAGIEPVFLTQPALYGPAIDPLTGVDLGALEVDRVRGMNGRMAWEQLELYNQVARDLGRQREVLVVDLAQRMAKRSDFFYDYHHFTNQGAEEVARLTREDLMPWLASRFPENLRAPRPAAAAGRAGVAPAAAPQPGSHSSE